jgi:hypothetical protein
MKKSWFVVFIFALFVSFVYATTMDTLNLNPTPFPFASLGTPTPGAQRYCNNCSITNPCSGSGTGAMARGEGTAWNCGAPATPVAAPTATPLVFGTPGVIPIYGSPELQPYAGSTCPTPGFATSLSAAGALGCATPIPATPASTATPAPTATPPPTAAPTPTTAPIVYDLAFAGCQNTTAGSFWDIHTSQGPTANCLTGTNTQEGTLDFADSGTFCAYFSLRLPSTYNSSGTTSAIVDWLTSIADNTKSAVWRLSTTCVADGESLDPSFNTANTVTSAANATANRKVSATISPVTMTGCSASEWLQLKFCRDPSDGSDNLGGTARALDLELTIPR